MWDQLLIDVQAATAVPTADGFGLIPEAAIAIAGFLAVLGLWAGIFQMGAML
jgi:hypothetical protein